MKSKSISKILLIGIVSICSISTLSAVDHTRTATIKVTHKVAKGCINGDTSFQMSEAGIDFPVLLQRAIGGDTAAVRLLFWASENIGLDGAGADGYGYYLSYVAKKIGDEKLVSVTKTLDRQTLDSIREYLLDEFGTNNPKQEVARSAEKKIITLFPEFWKLVKE